VRLANPAGVATSEFAQSNEPIAGRAKRPRFLLRLDMPDNDASDITTDIANSATKPASASIDGNSVTQVSIDDKIKARNDATAQQAAASNRPGLGLRFQQITPVYR
jgi:hypothetical protein